MALWKDVTQAYINAGGNTRREDLGQAVLSRLAFWNEALGDKEMMAISADDIDAALTQLASRGRLKGGKMATTATGEPLAGATINRYVSQAGSLFKYAKRMKIVPRAFVAPTRGVERYPERPDPERYLRPEQVAAALELLRRMSAPELFPFKFFDPTRKRWIQARYEGDARDRRGWRQG